MLRDLIRKRRETEETEEPKRLPEVPDNCFRKCNFCRKAILNTDVQKNFYRCPRCGGYFRVHAGRRIEMIADEGSFRAQNERMPFVNPLSFPGYEEKVQAAKEKYGLDEAVVAGSCTIEGREAVLCVCDGRFIMSSMGHNVGEKLTQAIEYATERKLPLIIYCCSGGARMQEGIVSLMQMAKTSAAVRRHREAGLLYISVLTNPTTGGVTASFAMLGDVILAEPKALIGFAGPRVIEQTIGQKLPEGFQRAEFLLAHGFVDAIAEREEQKAMLAALIDAHDAGVIAAAKEKLAAAYRKEQSEAENNTAEGAGETAYGMEKTCADGTAQDGTEPEGAKENGAERTADGENAEPSWSLPEKQAEKLPAWERVKRSRDAKRPRAMDYVERVFDGFFELHGDRFFGDDGAITGGIAQICGMPVTVIAQQKGRNMKENLRCNFGMPSPEGYRKARRLMQEADAFGRPIICFVDTPGAYPGIESEERGQGEAIAACLYELAGVRVPVLSIVVSEGGSGGALALAEANEVWMMENAVYSILSPEGFASILWKDAKRAEEASELMKITAEDLLSLGVIERIIPEGTPVSMETIDTVCAGLRTEIARFLGRKAELSGEELVKERTEKFRRM